MYPHPFPTNTSNACVGSIIFTTDWCLQLHMATTVPLPQVDCEMRNLCHQATTKWRRSGWKCCQPLPFQGPYFLCFQAQVLYQLRYQGSSAGVKISNTRQRQTSTVVLWHYKLSLSCFSCYGTANSHSVYSMYLLIAAKYLIHYTKEDYMHCISHIYLQTQLPMMDLTQNIDSCIPCFCVSHNVELLLVPYHLNCSTHYFSLLSFQYLLPLNSLGG